MEAFRLLHCSDLHLEASFASSELPLDAGNWRRADLRATLGHILNVAREQKVDVVTIAGDLYEQDYVLPDTADFLRQQFVNAAPIRIYIAPGDSDPYTTDSLYAITPWPENVTIFGPGPCMPVDLAPGIRLWGVAHPFGRRASFSRLELDPQDVNLLLVHTTPASGTSAGVEGCLHGDQRAVSQAGFTCALLGHQHKGRLWPKEAPICAYPGSPEPLDPGDADGDHSVLLVTIDDGRCQMQPLAVSRWRYLFLSADLSNCTDSADVVAVVESALAASRPAVDERTVVHMTLTGCPPVGLNLRDLAGSILSKAQILYLPQFSLPDGIEQFAQERTVRGSVVQRLQARIAEAGTARERQMLRNALQLSLQALEGREVNGHEIG